MGQSLVPTGIFLFAIPSFTAAPSPYSVLSPHAYAYVLPSFPLRGLWNPVHPSRPASNGPLPSFLRLGPFLLGQW